MGNQSSQLEATGEMAQHGHRGPQVFGPSMSPTPEPEDDNRAAPASGDHDHDLDQLSQNDRPSSDKKKKKRKKKKKEKEGDKSLDSHQAVVEEAAVAGTDEGAMQETTPKSNNKKRMSPRPHLEPEMDDDAVIEGTQLELPVEDIQESHPSPKRKREQSKKHPTSDHDPLPQNGTQDDDNHPRQTEAAREDGSHVGDELLHNGSAHALGVLQSPFSSNKKQRQRNKAGDASSSDAQHVLVSHTVDPAPPSAQFPDVHTILKYETTMDHDEDGAGVIPYSQSQPPRRDSSQSIGPGQIKREPDDDDSGLLDQPQLPLNGTAAVHLPYAVTDAVAEAQRENDAESGLGWLHKREEALQQSSFTGARESQLDRVFSDLQPSQVKAELDFDHGGGEDGGNMPNAYSSSQSNSHSPSVQRFVRLSRSRSRSASRATSRSGFLANQEVSDMCWTPRVEHLLTRFRSSGLPPLLDQIHTSKCPTVPHRARAPIDPSQLACPARRVQAPTSAYQLTWSLSPIHLAQHMADFSGTVLRQLLALWLLTSTWCKTPAHQRHGQEKERAAKGRRRRISQLNLPRQMLSTATLRSMATLWMLTKIRR